MVKKCVVVGCQSLSSREEDRGVTFHRFPLNVKFRPIWLTQCRVLSNNLTNISFVCSRHFRKVDFQAFKGKKYLLKQGVVPTIFPWGETKTETDEFLTTDNENVDHNEEDDMENESNSNSNDDNPILITADDKPEFKSVKRSASAEAGTHTEPKKKTSRKSSDSAMLKSATKKNLSKKLGIKKFDPIHNSPIRAEPVLNFAIGSRIEAQDFNEIWHTAKVVEVDTDDREVLIHFEKNVKGKNPGIFDEWIPMDSSRLRSIQIHKKAPISFVVGERCFARWSDARKFPACIKKVLENDMYEVLFDDGFVKIVKANHMAKIRPSEIKTLPPQKSQIAPSSSSSPATVSQSKPILQMSPPASIINAGLPIKVDYSVIPEPPKDGEWACHWLNDAPVGFESTVTYTDGKIYKTIIVADKRLPEGWVKHIYQRSGLLAKWDVLLVNPENRVYRSKMELKQHFETIGEVYNPNIYDFSLHKRRAKELNLCNYTPEYFAVSHYRIESKSPKVQNIVNTNIPSTSTVTTGTSVTSLSTSDTQLSKDEFVYVGSLKVQIIDNLFRCPKDDCLKNFRKENHLQIHIKHYHEEMAKLLGVCPNMSDLAYLRTVGQPIEESIPKNHLPNVQFFEKVHQQEIQTKTNRKSISSPPEKPEPEIIIENEIKEPVIEETIKSENDIILDTKHAEELETPQSLSPSAKRKYTLLEEALNSKPSLEKNYFMKQGYPLSTIQDGITSQANSDIPVQQTEIGINIDKIPKSAIKKHRGAVRRKIAKSRGQLVKRHGKLSDIERNNRLTNLSTFNETFTDYDDTRHSFRSGSPESAFKRQKLQLIDSGQENTNSQNTSSIAEQSQSPQYINEDGEVIKIVRMRQEEIINCICSYPEEDGLMIQCELCLCWQHGICNGIERENQVPEKYVCYICRNPQRGRGSLKYKHDQEWLFEGRLPVTRFHVPNSKRAERFDILKQSHTLTGNLLELKNFLHSLRIKINIAENKDHPKMYLWSKKWETSPIRGEITGIEPLHPHNSNVTKMDIKIKNEDAKSNLELTQIMQNETKSMEITEITNEKSDDDLKKDIKKTEESVLCGLLQTPGGTNIDFEKELEASTICLKREENAAAPNTNNENNAPNIPLPEAPIDSIECQFRLLEHIQKQQTTAMSRLQMVEAQIIALEAADDDIDKLEPNDSFTKTKLTIQMLIKDLTTMRKLAIINSSRLYGTHV